MHTTAIHILHPDGFGIVGREVKQVRKLMGVTDMTMKTMRPAAFRPIEEGNGGHDWDRTSDPCDVNTVLYR